MTKYTKLHFAGETFSYDNESNRLYVLIREPYYSAGKQFGWAGSPVGLGINEYALEFAIKNRASIRVFVGNTKDRVYETDAEHWRKFALGHNAIETRGSTTLYVIQWSRENFKTIRLRKGGDINE